MSKTIQVFFRCDANAVIGRGHLSRCIAIADMLENKVPIFFIIKKENESFAQQFLDGRKSHFIENDDDLLIHADDHTVVCIDGYHFTEDVKSSYKQNVLKLIEINDIPYAAQNVHAVINHTPGLSVSEFSDVDEQVSLHLGLDYCLLRDEFLKMINSNDSDKSQVKSGIFVCFGGADPLNIGRGIVENLIDLGFKDEIIWVAPLGRSNERLDKKSQINIHSNLEASQMIHQMQKSKMVFIPSSVICFEAIAVRCPIFTCYFVDNQQLIYKGLMEKELATGSGLIENKEDIYAAVVKSIEFYNNDPLHKQQMIRQANSIDGKSEERLRKIFIGND